MNPRTPEELRARIAALKARGLDPDAVEILTHSVTHETGTTLHAPARRDGRACGQTPTSFDVFYQTLTELGEDACQECLAEDLFQTKDTSSGLDEELTELMDVFDRLDDCKEAVSPLDGAIRIEALIRAAERVIGRGVLSSSTTSLMTLSWLHDLPTYEETDLEVRAVVAAALTALRGPDGDQELQELCAAAGGAKKRPALAPSTTWVLTDLNGLEGWALFRLEGRIAAAYGLRNALLVPRVVFEAIDPRVDFPEVVELTEHPGAAVVEVLDCLYDPDGDTYRTLAVALAAAQAL